MSTATSMAIEALRAVLGNQESMRQFAEFRYCFSDEKIHNQTKPCGRQCLTNIDTTVLP